MSYLSNIQLASRHNEDDVGIIFYMRTAGLYIYKKQDFNKKKKIIKIKYDFILWRRLVLTF